MATVPARLKRTVDALGPVSLVALLATLVLLFGFQGEQILAQPLIILMLAVPILIQVFFNSGLAYLLNYAVRSPHCVAGPSALIGASNFFELAVATAIVLFGFQSGAALATVVGVLIEVPVMLARGGGGQPHARLVRAPARRADLRGVLPGGRTWEGLMAQHAAPSCITRLDGVRQPGIAALRGGASYTAPPATRVTRTG